MRQSLDHSTPKKSPSRPKDSPGSVKSSSSRHSIHGPSNKQRVSPDSYEGRCSQSDSGSTRSHTPSKSIDRSDAESISTTISQDSRGSNKENNHVVQNNNSANGVPTSNHHNRSESRQSSELDEEVVLRRKPEYTREIPRRTKEESERIQMMNLKKKTRKRTRKFEIDGVVVTTTTSKVSFCTQKLPIIKCQENVLRMMDVETRIFVFHYSVLEDCFILNSKWMIFLILLQFRSVQGIYFQPFSFFL